MHYKYIYNLAYLKFKSSATGADTYFSVDESGNLGFIPPSGAYLDMNLRRITSVGTPTAANDAIRAGANDGLDGKRAPDSQALQGYSPQGIRDMNTLLKCTSIVWSADIVAGAPTPDYYMEFSEPSGVYKYRVPCYRFTIP